MKDYNPENLDNMANKNRSSAPRKGFGNRGRDGYNNYRGGAHNRFGGNRNSYGNNRSFGRQPQLLQKIIGESPSSLENEFYNPYTFIPFPTQVDRGVASFLTIDEKETERFTGVLNLKVKTLSPLMTCNPEPYEGKVDEHKKYHALTMGKDVILPATSVRGSLRTLMTILAGGTLGYLDTNAWLCQGRDLSVGPTTNNKSLPVFLAKVERPGGYNKSGTLRLGESWLIDLEKLENITNKSIIKSLRPGVTRDFYVDDQRNPQMISTRINDYCFTKLKLSNNQVYYVDDLIEPSRISLEKTPECPKILIASNVHLFVDDYENPTRMETDKSSLFRYELKLSGCPVASKFKREGVFLAGDTVIDVPASIWETYIGRNRNGACSELKAGDLVWIEPKNPYGPVNTAEDINSIQWARWGRQGQLLKDALPDCVIPDCLREDGLVDSITDLWGQVPMVEGRGDIFASRIRPHNIVFENGVEKLNKNVTLAPLAQPHPGCVPFYRQGDPSSISKSSPLNGYKVYRNTEESGGSAPWNYSEQGVFDGRDLSRPSNPHRKLNKTVDLLLDGVEGSLKISCRGLSKKELALLLLACCVDWKLGGGKPLGLGHCRIVKAELLNEFGEKILNLFPDANGVLQLPAEYAELISNLSQRVEWYKKSQEPVDNLRYPRSVSSNKGGLRREGPAWFGYHATLKKPPSKKKVESELNNSVEGGLETLAVGEKHYNGMVLGNIQTNPNPLYCYDMIGVGESKERGQKKVYERFEKFDPEKHKPKEQKRFPNNSPNRYTRRNDRDGRDF